MKDGEAVQRAIGVVTALQIYKEDDGGVEWRKTIDILTDDLSPTDKVGVMLELGGMVLGCVEVMIVSVPTMTDMSIEEFLTRLGRLMVTPPNIDPDQQQLEF